MLFKLSWYYIRMLPQLMRGAWKIARLPQPVVSVFGGTHLPADSKYAHWAEEIAARLSEYNISILTGGGTGIMEAANCGAFRNKGSTMGIGVKGIPDEEFPNGCTDDSILVDDFAIRRHLLIQYSKAFVIFPGGFGTLDELAEVLVLIQLDKLPVMPVILMGESFWKPMLSWMHGSMKYKFIASNFSGYFIISDDVNRVVQRIIEHCDTCRKS